MTDILSKSGSEEFLNRIEDLTSDTTPKWGKMNVGQMLAHCNVTYEMTFENKHKKPGPFAKILLKLFVKNAVVGPKPYPKNGRTAPQFIIIGDKEFETEKMRLIGYINKCLELGPNHFIDKESHSFGKLSVKEWNTMFSKHLDHHLTQFGV